MKRKVRHGQISSKDSPAYLFDDLEEVVGLVEALSFLLHLLLEALPFIVELAQLVPHIGFTLRIAN